MRKISFISTVALVVSLVMLGTTLALAGAPTREEAKAMVEKAIAAHKSAGKAATLEEVNKPDGKFSKGPELFAFAMDTKGNVLAHPFNHALIGKDMSNVKDVDGKYFSKEMAEMGNVKGSGWVEYKWTNPASKKTEPKVSFVQKADDVIYACGIYVK